jgi:predicted DNA-binding transcriptional regulator AlpA
MSKKKLTFVSKAEVCLRTGKTFQTLWTWMREGKFPRARDCNGQPVWLEDEFEDWMRSRPVKQYKPAEVA